MVEVGLEARVALGDDRVGDALHALASESETPGDHRDAEPAGRGDPHHLPPRLGLAGEVCDRLAVAAQGSGDFEDVGDQTAQRKCAEIRTMILRSYPSQHNQR